MGRPQGCSCQCGCNDPYLYYVIKGIDGGLDRLEKRQRSNGALVNTWSNITPLVNFDRISSLDPTPHFYAVVGKTVYRHNFFGFNDYEEVWSYEETDTYDPLSGYRLVAVDAFGNVCYVASIDGVSAPNVNNRFRVRKLDENGASLWVYTRTPPGHEYYRPIAAAVDSNGNVFACGERADSFYLSSGRVNIYIDSSGNEAWSDISTNQGDGITLNAESYGFHPMFDSNGNVYVQNDIYLVEGAEQEHTHLDSYTPDGSVRYRHAFDDGLSDFFVRGDFLYTIQFVSDTLVRVAKRETSDPAEIIWEREISYNDDEATIVGQGAKIVADCKSVFIELSYQESPGDFYSHHYRLREKNGGEVYSYTVNNGQAFHILLPPGLPPAF